MKRKTNSDMFVSGSELTNRVTRFLALSVCVLVLLRRTIRGVEADISPSRTEETEMLPLQERDEQSTSRGGTLLALAPPAAPAFARGQEVTPASVALLRSRDRQICGTDSRRRGRRRHSLELRGSGLKRSLLDTRWVF